MRIQRKVKDAYNRLSDGLRTVSSIIEKSAHVYSLTQPLLRQSFDTRALDDWLMAAHAKYQHSRQFAHQLDAVVNK